MPEASIEASPEEAMVRFARLMRDIFGVHSHAPRTGGRAECSVSGQGNSLGYFAQATRPIRADLVDHPVGNDHIVGLDLQKIQEIELAQEDQG